MGQAPDIRLVAYDRCFLDRSWDWLRDPELKALTLTPDFTRAEQEAFFEALPTRADYRIWGVATAEGERIGAAGIKHIDGGRGEVWLYIGERSWWGRGIGGRILELCEEKARGIGIDHLTMIAAATNMRSVRAFEKMGFALDDVVPGDGLVQLGKTIAP